MLTELLRLEGYDVETVMSMSAGMRALRSRTYDLVITDYGLPDGTGTDMLRAAQREGALGAARLVLFTAHPEPPRDEGVVIVRKPLAVDSFMKTIYELLEPARGAALERARRRDSSTTMRAVRPVGPRVELMLYISRSSLASLRALRAMDQLLLSYEADDVKLTVVDLAKDASRVADEDRIVFTPTLVQRYPQPKARILGDLEDIQVVVDLLEAAGVKRKREL
jgi:CheY-like chemotaxis protein